MVQSTQAERKQKKITASNSRRFSKLNKKKNATNRSGELATFFIECFHPMSAMITGTAANTAWCALCLDVAVCLLKALYRNRRYSSAYDYAKPFRSVPYV